MVKVKGERVVIFGGSGFIGASLARKLIKLGARVTLADKNLPGGFLRPYLRKINFCKIDILNLKDLKSVLKKKKYVFNLAAVVPFSLAKSDYLTESISINVRGAANIALAARDEGLKKLVFVSGYVVYGVPEYLPLDERHPTNPIDIYGASKLAAEKYLQVICNVKPVLELVVLRLASVYGPGQITRGLIPNSIRAALDNSEVVINATGKEKRDYLFIDDAVNALTLSLKKGATGTFNVGSNASVSANQIKETIEYISGRQIKSRYLNNRGLIPEVILSNKLAQKHLGFKPKVSITEGLGLAYRWYKNEKYIS